MTTALLSGFCSIGKDINVVADLFTAMPYTLEQQTVNYAFEDYMKGHPGVKILPFSSLNVTGPASKSGKLMSVAGGTPPDIWMMWFHETIKYSEQGFVMPLNKFIGEDRNGDGAISDDEVTYEPWKNVSREIRAACVKDGKIYALPYPGGVRQALVYRRDLFRQSGLDPDKSPLTWDELWTYARKLTFKQGESSDKPKDQKGLYFVSPGYLCFNPMVWAAGGELVKKYKVNPKTGKTVEALMYDEILKDPETGEDLSKVEEHWKAAFDSPEGLKALEFIRKLRWQKWAKDTETKEPFDLTEEMLKDKKAISPEGREFELTDDSATGNIYTGVLFISMGTEDDKNIYKVASEGRIGMIFGYNNIANEIINKYGLSPDEFGMGPMPVEKGRSIIGCEQPVMLGISVKKRTEETEAAAWDIISNFTSDKNLNERTRIMVEGGKGRLVYPPFLKAAGYDELYESLPASWRNIEGLIQKNQTEPFNNGWTEVQSEVTPAVVQKIWNDENIDLKALLAQAAADADKRFEKWPEAELVKYRPWAWILWTLSIVGFLFALTRIVKSMSVKKAEHKALGIETVNKRSFKMNFIYLWAIPALLSVLMWQYYPLLRGSIMAFQEYRISGGSKWMGVDNFIMLFGNVNFYYTMLRTFYYVGLTILIGFFVPIVLAILLTEIPRGKILFRTIFYLPAVASSLVVMFMWKEFYDSAPTGFLNSIIITMSSWVGVKSEGFKWLADPQLAMMCVIIPGVWAGAGAGSLIYQAALTGIPYDLYEAADVDGAGFFTKIRHITIPTLKPLIIINFVGVFIGAFHAMQNIFVMTGGGPFNATRVIGIDIWFNAFLYLNFGMATAMAWVLGLMLIGFTVMQLKILTKVEFRKAEEN
jgi:multiple sugar transport system permease protein